MKKKSNFITCFSTFTDEVKESMRSCLQLCFFLTVGVIISSPASASPPKTTVASINFNGTLGNSNSHDPAINVDGRFVAFTSEATNLVDGDTNGVDDIFIHDRQNGTTTRVSVKTDGTPGDSYSYDPALSADGRYVAFSSDATNLVDEDRNGVGDIFVHDRDNGTTTRVSVKTNGDQGNGSSSSPALSADGRYVAFSSDSTNLVDEDTKGVGDIFVHDRDSGTTTRVSVKTDGTPGDSYSYDPAVSADGRYVTFSSDAANLVDGDTKGVGDIFVHDRDNGITTRVSVKTNGEQGNGGSNIPAISADGRYVAFFSAATNLVDGDTNGVEDIFVHDRLSGTTTRVSVKSNGEQGDKGSYLPNISTDGGYVAFYSSATNLVDGDTNTVRDVFVHDRLSGTTTRVSVGGTQGNSDSYAPAISADGRYVTFYSSATNLVDGDTNNSVDVFVHDRLKSFPWPMFLPAITGIKPW